MFEVIVWLLIVIILGVSILPLTVWLGKDLFLRATPVASLLGTLSVTLFTWLLTNLGIFQYHSSSIIVSLGLLIICNILILKRSPSTVEWLQEHLGTTLLSQFIVALPFLAYSYLRTFNPNIDNFEKFMDMNFVNALLRTTTFPPQDTWFAGQPINYYYFGHLVSATLIKLTGVASDIGYNLSLATVFSFAWASAFTLGSSLIWLVNQAFRQAFKAGVLTALLVNCAGTLYTFSFLFKEDLPFFWFWSAIRLIPYSIHEFPAYSFAVGDLHAHMLNVPHVLLALILLTIHIQAILTDQKLRQLVSLLVLGATLGIMVMTSAWDLPMYAGLTGITIFFTYWWKNRHLTTSLLLSCKEGVLLVAALFSSSFFFFRHFDSSIAGGVGLVQAHTSVQHFMILWGPQLLVTVAAIWWIATKSFKKLPFFYLLSIVWVCWVGVLLLIPEILYIKDIYGDLNHRLNTILKFYYQAFILAGITSAFFMSYLFPSMKHIWGKVWKAAVVVLFALTLTFPFQVLPDYYGNFQHSTNLEGKAFMQWELVEDKIAIDWINQNISGQPVMVEAAGDSYTHFNRISTFTGIPTIQGWFVHEWLWRGGPEKPGERANDVALLYEADISISREIIEKYNVEYIYIGNLERQKYPTLNEDRLASLGEIIFSTDTVKIIRIR